MKKIITLIAILFLFVGCCESGNQGYGYNTQTTTEKPQEKDIFTRASERQKNFHMTLRGLDGKALSTCTVYKGEFDGHTWYVFYDNLASPSVVHDPLCKCKGE